jgi:hypothetical protein
MPFLGEMPNDLVKAVGEGRGVAFVGAGMSRSVTRRNGKGLPSWSELIQEMFNLSRPENSHLSGYEKDIKSAIASGRFLLVAQEISDQLGPSAVSRFLRDVFLDSALKPTEIHRRLVDIPFRGVLTTNYDTLIEGAYTLKMDGRIPPVFTQEDLEKIPNPLRIDGVFVFKVAMTTKTLYSEGQDTGLF